MGKATTQSQLLRVLSRIQSYFAQVNKEFTGATSDANGTKGLVTQPIAGDNMNFLRGDGTWANPIEDDLDMRYQRIVPISSTTPSEPVPLWDEVI